MLICDDEPVMRRLIRQTLKSQTDLCVVAEAANGHEAVSAAQHHAPDVVVMDIDMPELDGIDASAAILKKFPAAKIVIFSGNRREEDVERALALGISAYIGKQLGSRLLPFGIRQALMGNHYFVR